MCSLFLQTLQTQQAPLEHRPVHSRSVYVWEWGEGSLPFPQVTEQHGTSAPKGRASCYPTLPVFTQAGGYVSIEQKPYLGGGVSSDFI